MSDMNSVDIEIAIIMTMFPPRRFLVLPNASWGLQIQYEMDLLVISKAGCGYEIEIKISVADMKRDLKKWKHRSGAVTLDRRIKQFYYAFPAALSDKIAPFIPDYAGAISVAVDEYGIYRTQVVKSAPIRKDVRKFTDDEIKHAGLLAQMRYWDIRKNIHKNGARTQFVAVSA